MSAAAGTPTMARGGGLRLTGVCVIVSCAVARMFVGFDPFPAWDSDPFILSTPSTQVGPAGSILLDVITIAAACVTMFGVWLGGWRARLWMWAAIGAASAVVGWHSRLGAEVVIDHLRVGSQWVAALIGAGATFEACREERLRRLTVASLVGAVMMLACKGALQIWVEHPQTVALYQQNRLEFFASQGWAEDSSAARAFERRLVQPEATGWFGMANVFASWGAFGGASLMSMLLLTRRGDDGVSRPRWVTASLAVGAIAGVACVAMAGSKGGWAALALGVGLGGVAWLATGGAAPGWMRRTVRVAPMGCVAVALGAVLVRGLIGERLHETSLLFRWFYDVGASRIFGAHPFIGVGPDGFKDAYMILKPPLSPEEVTSPHSLIFDLASMLGLAGVGVSLVWLAWTWRAGSWLGSSVGAPANAPEPGSMRRDVRLLFLVLSVPTVFGAIVEIQSGTPEAAVARMAGLGFAVLVASGAAATIGPRALAGLACGAGALAAHAQIELTPVWVGSAPAFFLAFGAIGSVGGGPARGPEGLTKARGALVVAVGVGVLGIAWLGLGWRPVGVWQGTLERAREFTSAPAEARSLMAQLESPENPDRSATAGVLSDLLSRTLGRPVGPSPDTLSRGADELFLVSAERALDELKPAADHVGHPGTYQAVSRLALQVAALHRSRGEVAAASAFADTAVDYAKRATETPLRRASSLGWLGTVYATLAASSGDRSELELAVSAWEGAAREDPWGLTWPPRLARVLRSLGRSEDAAAWARKALENNDWSRLDPLRGLPEAERAEMSRLAAGS